MKKFVALFPLIFLFVTISCSESPEKDVKSEEPIVKPLIEREPEVREYFEVLDELLDEYVLAAEIFLDSYDKKVKGDIKVLEQIEALGELYESYSNVMELTDEFSELEIKRTDLERSLSEADIIEFGLKFSEKMVRYKELYKRIEETDYHDVAETLDGYF